jgi:hypothetical protein
MTRQLLNFDMRKIQPKYIATRIVYFFDYACAMTLVLGFHLPEAEYWLKLTTQNQRTLSDE